MCDCEARNGTPASVRSSSMLKRGGIVSVFIGEDAISIAVLGVVFCAVVVVDARRDARMSMCE
jgi:hypothetical protein